MESFWSDVELNSEEVTKRQLLEKIVSIGQESFLNSNQMSKNTVWNEITKKKWTKPQLIQIYKSLLKSSTANSSSENKNENNKSSSKEENNSNQNQNQNQTTTTTTSSSSPSSSTTTTNSPASPIEKAVEIILNAEGILIVVGCSHSNALFQNWKNDSEFHSSFPQFAKLKIGYSEIESREFRDENNEMYWGFSSMFREKANSTNPSEFHKSILSIAQIPVLKKQQQQKQQQTTKETEKETTEKEKETTEKEKETTEKEKEKIDLMGHGFLMSSNVDGLFEKTGISSTKIVESNGSIWHLQCVNCDKVWSWPFSSSNSIPFDKNTLLINDKSLIPKCEKCGREARLNVMGSTDLEFVNQRQDIQRVFLNRFLERHLEELTVIEIGVDQINEIDLKIYCDNFLNSSFFDIHPSLGTRRKKTNLIRIHPTQSQVKWPGVSISMECEKAISEISNKINSILNSKQTQEKEKGNKTIKE